MSNNKIMRFVVSAVAIVALMTLTAFATDITGGFGAIGGVDDTYYAAPATLNAAGDGLDLGEAIQLTDAKNTGLAGLYAVSTDSTFESDYEIVYVYGDYSTRERLATVWGVSTTDPWPATTNSRHVEGEIRGVDSWNHFAPGYFTGGCYWRGHASYNQHELIPSGTQQQFNSSYKQVWFYNNTWESALAEATELAAGDKDLLSAYKATIDELWGAYYKEDAPTEFIDAEKEKLYNTAKAEFYQDYVLYQTQTDIDIKYAYNSDQIIPISEVNSFNIRMLLRGGALGYSQAFSSKVVAYVYDPEADAVSKYTGISTPFTLNKSLSTAIKFDFTDKSAWESALPERGYLVGIQIFPLAGMNDPEKFTVNVNARTPVTVANYKTYSDNSWIGVVIGGGDVQSTASLTNGLYYIDTPKASKPEGLGINENGTLTGTIIGMAYEYAKLSSADMLNEKELIYAAVDDTTVLTDAGLYAVKVVGVEGEYTTSDAFYIYKPGDVDEKESVIERTEWTVSGKKSVAADKVAYDDAGNPIDPDKGNPLKLVGTTYYVVAVDEDGDGWDDKYTSSMIAEDKTNGYWYVCNYTELRVAAKNTSDFADGYVTASGISTNFWSGNFRDWSVGVTSGRNISSNDLSAFKAAQDADPYDDDAKKVAFETIANESLKSFSYSYAIPAEKVSTIEEIGSYTYRLYFYEDVKYEGLKVKFEAFVMDDNGVVTPYTYIHNATDVTAASVALGLEPAVFTVDFGTETNGKWDSQKPTSGYLLGFKIYPFYGFTDYTKFTVTSTSQTNLMFYPGENGIVIKTAPDTPDVTVNAGSNTLTVNNFASGTTYAYSYDEGETWTQFITKTIDLPKLANTYYWVKACADAGHFESEIAKPETPSACLVFKGASLVLDGKIGIRFYFDFDASASGNMTQIKFDIYNGETKIDDRDFLFKVSHQSWERASFKDDERTAYITFYTAPKDYNDLRIDTEYVLTFDPDGNRTNISSTVGDGYTITGYLEAFYRMVNEGDEECIAANDFVTALEAYCKNADVFFDNNAQALDSVVADENAIEATANPEKSGKITYGTDTILEHYSTSLILEDEITIRHYFKWNKIEGSSLEGLTAKLDGEVDIDVDTESCVKASTTGEEGVNYLYIDIENVNVDNLNRLYTLDLTLGEETISVKYAVANYIKSTYNSGDTKLANLVKAIYNCYEEWVDYPFKEERDKTLSEQRQEIKEAMTLAINTKTVWKEVPEFNPTIEEYSHIKAITYDGLEYKGGKTKIFAYVGFPEGASEESPVPAVVLVHGGGGHPYMEWVRLWNERGYAAIAMETTGYFPLVANAGTIGGTTDNANFSYGLTEDFAEEGYVSAPGPDRLYPTEYMEVSEQWAYHGISQVILAGNILRQDKRVDVDNIGITGISWGGVTTTQVIGYDNRFSFAIPIYGMAYLGDEMRSFTNFNDPYVNALWASERNLDNAKMPIFWFAYNDDNNFGVNQYVKSYNHTENFNDKNTLTMLGGWGHSHVSGWAKNQSYYFADWVTYGEKGFITFDSQPEGREVDFKVTIPDNVKGDVTARVYYITEPMSYSRHDKFENGLNYVYLDQFWQTADEGIEVDVETGSVTGTVPEEARGYYINLSFAIEEGSDEIMEVSSVYVALE